MGKKEAMHSPDDSWIKERLNLHKDWKQKTKKYNYNLPSKKSRPKLITAGHTTDENIKWGREKAKELMRIKFFKEGEE